jgi:hypothetical protein
VFLPFRLPINSNSHIIFVYSINVAAGRTMWVQSGMIGINSRIAYLISSQTMISNSSTSRHELVVIFNRNTIFKINLLRKFLHEVSDVLKVSRRTKVVKVCNNFANSNGLRWNNSLQKHCCLRRLRTRVDKKLFKVTADSLVRRSTKKLVKGVAKGKKRSTKFKDRSVHNIGHFLKLAGVYNKGIKTIMEFDFCAYVLLRKLTPTNMLVYQIARLL